MLLSAPAEVWPLSLSLSLSLSYFASQDDLSSAKNIITAIAKHQN